MTALKEFRLQLQCDGKNWLATSLQGLYYRHSLTVSPHPKLSLIASIAPCATPPYHILRIHIRSLGYQQLCCRRSSLATCAEQRRPVLLNPNQREGEEGQLGWCVMGRARFSTQAPQLMCLEIARYLHLNFNLAQPPEKARIIPLPVSFNARNAAHTIHFKP